MRLLSSNALVATCASFASAHSWIEQMSVLAQNGTMTGTPGFARGNVLRTAPGFNDNTMVNLIPPDGRPVNDVLSTDLMCRHSQSTQTQTSGSPRLQAQAGANVALRYQENGHVTLPQNQPGKPANRGTVFVYGTNQSSPTDTLTSIHRVWNAAGTGGDGRGVLLSTQNFDDGQCYQINKGNISEARQQEFPHPADQLQGADLWCQQDIQIPSDAQSGSPYTLYWVWDWPTLPGTPGFPQGKQEIYTTCMDVDVVGNNATKSLEAVGNQFIVGQNFANAGIQTQIANIANPTAVTGQSIAFPSAAVSATPNVSAQPAATTAVDNTQSASPTPFTHTTDSPNEGIATTTAIVSPVEATPGPAGVAVTVTTSVTQTEAVTETNVVTVTAAARRAEETAPVPHISNSKTESIYRLRARNVF